MFRQEVDEPIQHAAQELADARAALSLQLLCGEDLKAVLASGSGEKQRVARKLLHRLERERLRGLRGHWNYDLNRHIGLRQALNLISDNPAKTA